MSPSPVTVPVDFISGDYNSNDSVNSARLHGRQMANLGQPWDLMAWAFSQVKDVGAVYKPAAQLQQEAAVILALGWRLPDVFPPPTATADSPTGKSAR